MLNYSRAYPEELGLDRIGDDAFQAQDFVIWVKRERHHGVRTSFRIFLNAEDQVATLCVGERAHVGDELFLVVARSSNKCLLEIELISFFNGVCYQRVDVSLDNFVD